MVDSIKIKKEIIKKYGSELSIGYFYYSYNPINYMGEEQVRKSFDSIKKYGKKVYIGDYSSTDGTKELTEEYGFTYLKVEKTPGFYFHESKIANKIFKEAKENFLCYLNYWINYPENFEDIMLRWLKTNNGSAKCLKMTGFATSEKGKLGKTRGITHSVSHLLYRPFFYEARGIDERTSYHAGTRNYAYGLIRKVYEMKIVEVFVPFVHAFHTNSAWDKIPIKQQKHGLRMAEQIVENLRGKFYIEVKKVKNSYW